MMLSLPDKKVFVLDLSKNLEQQIDFITRQMTVFVSYSIKDKKLGKQSKMLCWNEIISCLIMIAYRTDIGSQTYKME